MPKYVLVNRQCRTYEYDFGGNTKILPAQSETEVSSHEEAQLALTRYQNAGVSLKELPE